MLTEMKQAKRFFGIKFGYGEPLQDGVYAIPTVSSNGYVFMKMVVKNGEPYGDENFSLYWDEKLTAKINHPRPKSLKESKFSKAFRVIDALV